MNPPDLSQSTVEELRAILLTCDGRGKEVMELFDALVRLAKTARKIKRVLKPHKKRA